MPLKFPCGIPIIDEARASVIIGSDEAGYGSWAGPLVACAVAVPCDWSPPDPELYNPKYPADPSEYPYRDSKALSEAERNRVFDRYWNQPHPEIIISPWDIPADEVDSYGAGHALKLAHRTAIRGTFMSIACPPIIVVDGVVDPGFTLEECKEKVFTLPKGDQRIPAITLASIIAKVYRDREMTRLAGVYPGYSFEKHKGYGTKAHDLALQRLGPCAIHRKSYAPIQAYMKPQRPVWEDD